MASLVLSGILTTCHPSVHLLSYGDSKTMTRLQLGGSTNLDAFQTLLSQALGDCGPKFDVGNPVGVDGALARGSHNVAEMKALVDADLGLMGGSPTYILSNLGTVDLVEGFIVTEENFKADYGYILDAFHVKYPAAHVYVVKPWIASQPVNAVTMSSWIDDILSTRSEWAHAGHDEAVWAKGSDNGATMMYDGVHYSMAGSAECAAQWRAILGF